MKIEIVNWEDRNPRSDYKSIPWWRCDANFYRSKKLFGLPLTHKWTYLALLCIAAEENKGGFLEAEAEWLLDQIKIPEIKLAVFLAAIEALESRGLLKITDVSRTPDGRITNASRALRNDTIRYVTERDVTNDLPGAPGPGEAADQALVPSQPSSAGRKAPKGPPIGAPVFEAYAAAFQARYKQAPVRNARVNSQCKQLAERLGVDGAVKTVTFYVTHNNRQYVQATHSIGLCLRDAEGLHTQMLAGYQVSGTEAQRQDQQQGNRNSFAAAAALLAARPQQP